MQNYDLNIDPPGKLHVILRTDEHLKLLHHYHRRFQDELPNILANAITEFKLRAESPYNTEPETIQYVAKQHISGESHTIKSQYEGISASFGIDDALLCPTTLSNIRSDMVNQLVSFEGTIIGTEIQRAIPDKIVIDAQNHIPVEDYDEKEHGPAIDTTYQDVQVLLVEETGKEYTDVRTPRRIPVHIFGKTVGTLEEGQKLKIWAYYRVLQGTDRQSRQVLDYYMECITMQKLEDSTEVEMSDEDLALFQHDSTQNNYLTNLTKSFVPHITENHIPKLLCLLIAVGATDLKEYRSEMHGYLVGNPGTGKSDMIREAAMLRYRAAYADAPNASSRGLTYGQEEFQKHKILKSGLLVRNELVALDELDKMSNDQRQDINTVLEQQVASYHKAGFDRDTHTHVSLLAAGNPKFSRWSSEIPLMDNLEPVQAELISRMIVCRVHTTSNTSHRIQHVLNTIQKRDGIAPPYTRLQLMSLISYSRKLEPKLSEEAEQAIISFLVKFESIEQAPDANLPIETRQEIEIIRIATAFAKLLLQDTVDKKAVEMAIQFYKDAMTTLGIQADDAPVQLDLRGTATNRDQAFRQIIEDLESHSEDGTFTEFDVLQSMSETIHWKTPVACRQYWEKMLKANKLAETKPGVFKWV